MGVSESSVGRDRFVKHASATDGRPIADWQDLAVRRVGYLAAVGTVVGALSWALSFLRVPNVGAREGTERPVILIPVWILLSGTVWLVSRREKLSRGLRVDAGLAYLVLASACAAVFRHWLPYNPADVLRGFSPTAFAILFFAVVVPVHPVRMAVAAGLAAMFDPLVLYVTTLMGNPVPPWNLWLWLSAPTVVVVPVAVVTSSFLYRIGKSLARAREMGSYRLVEKLGEGGMGEVWLARHRMLARPAAIKLISPSRIDSGQHAERTARILRRFEREAQATAALESPHTIEVFDFGTDDAGTFFYVMELLEGLDLAELVEQEGALPPARTVNILLGICHSLEDAHAHGLIHRDIKPANVFLTRRGTEFDFVKVLDFGLVKTIGEAETPEETRLTRDDAILGSPGYMAPEILRGAAPTEAVDIYAFGCVAYWLLAGRRVFEAGTMAMLLTEHFHSRPTPLSEAAKDKKIPPELDALVLGCLEKAPKDRPGSFTQIKETLRGLSLCHSWTNDDARSWWEARQAETPKEPGPVEGGSAGTRTL